MIDKTTVGIDVSKFALDVFIDTSERLIHLENSASGIMQLLKEPGALTRRQISALVSVCPYHRDSGQLRGKRANWGGRAGLRATLYMAMLSAVRYNPQIKDFYTSLIARGKVKNRDYNLYQEIHNDPQCYIQGPKGLDIQLKRQFTTLDEADDT